jgi:hypothetical protein
MQIPGPGLRRLLWPMRGSSTKFVISPIRSAAVVALGRRTALWLAGTLDVAAPIADGCKATRPRTGTSQVAESPTR